MSLFQEISKNREAHSKMLGMSISDIGMKSHLVIEIEALSK
jgi:hypothetical protein